MSPTLRFAMSDEEYQRRLKQQTLIGKNFIEPAFRFWFEDREGFRSPFPPEIQAEIFDATLRLLMEWSFALSDADRRSLSGRKMSDKLTEILFQVGLSLARSDEDRLSIRCPDLPRIGDHVDIKGRKPGTVAQRRLVERDGHLWAHITVRIGNGADFWDTEFDLGPASR